MLRAGRVGVNPSQVDSFGNIIGGETVDAYTKTQSDAKYVNKTQLKANNKNFNFAYDSETGKYGYKLNSDGDFIPFSQGANTGIIVNNPITTGITPESYTHIINGGYEKIGDIYYIDITCTCDYQVGNGSGLFKNMPFSDTSVLTVIGGAHRGTLRKDNTWKGYSFDGEIPANTEFKIYGICI